METLLRLLQQDANTPREDLARLLNLSVEETNARIAAFEKEGVIRGYQAIVDAIETAATVMRESA